MSAGADPYGLNAGEFNHDTRLSDPARTRRTAMGEDVAANMPVLVTERISSESVRATLSFGGGCMNACGRPGEFGVGPGGQIGDTVPDNTRPPVNPALTQTSVAVFKSELIEKLAKIGPPIV